MGAAASQPCCGSDNSLGVTSSLSCACKGGHFNCLGRPSDINKGLGGRGDRRKGGVRGRGRGRGRGGEGGGGGGGRAIAMARTSCLHADDSSAAAPASSATRGAATSASAPVSPLNKSDDPSSSTPGQAHPAGNPNNPSSLHASPRDGSFAVAAKSSRDAASALSTLSSSHPHSSSSRKKDAANIRVYYDYDRLTGRNMRRFENLFYDRLLRRHLPEMGPLATRAIINAIRSSSPLCNSSATSGMHGDTDGVSSVHVATDRRAASSSSAGTTISAAAAAAAGGGGGERGERGGERGGEREGERGERGEGGGGGGEGGGDTQITSLPESLISEVLGRLGAVSDLRRAARVCSLFARASRSNLTWQHFVPPGYHRICRLHPAPVRNSVISRDMLMLSYVRLVDGFFDCVRPHIHYHVDKTTNALSVNFCATQMDVQTAQNFHQNSHRRGERVKEPFCGLISIRDSPFQEGIELVCLRRGRFHVSGLMTCALPRGRYVCTWTCAWRYNLVQWSREVKCRSIVQPIGGPVVARTFSNGQDPVGLYPRLTEVRVGVINVEGQSGRRDQKKKKHGYRGGGDGFGRRHWPSDEEEKQVGEKGEKGEEEEDEKAGVVRTVIRFRLVINKDEFVIGSFGVRSAKGEEEEEDRRQQLQQLEGADEEGEEEEVIEE
ncbi:hypothetical protein CBR_g46321 [Chara braunii]|uniref:F-box domain-containing protein n=1 Tax=Chara braunii TaxID=69332 RepID=A0A388M0C0_CHABU|nr:hypothetical protein CBR_g46321 [Chara braunii]|eukprot:GBG87955.1 hypothetical protein CBR_g46321 [Chara braunii]